MLGMGSGGAVTALPPTMPGLTQTKSSAGSACDLEGCKGCASDGESTGEATDALLQGEWRRRQGRARRTRLAFGADRSLQIEDFLQLAQRACVF